MHKRRLAEKCGKTPSTEIALNRLISSAGFMHGGSEKQFGYSYLPGSNQLQTLTTPNGMTLTQTYESTRDLLTGMAYHRGSTLVAQRTYTYDILGRPTARNTARQGSVVNDTFAHNSRSELIDAQVNGKDYEYAYDNIGNRTAAVEDSSGVASRTEYAANQLNQYTAIGDFAPTFDDAGNQAKVKTSTGIWSVVYNAENRPISFSNADSGTIVECTYDYMGRRATKKVTVNGNVTLHQRFLYRGYLQIACCDLTRSNHPCLWLITWDPSQPVATRPLAIQLNGTWYTYGWDLTKNICELYGQHGYIRTAYTYTPYGQVTAEGDVEQAIQWSSEFNDTELGLIYYNYRHYNPMDGRWTGRDNVVEDDNLYCYCENNVFSLSDIKGAYPVIVMIDSIGGPSVYIDSDLMRINFAYQKTIDELGKLQNREFEKLKENNSVLWNNEAYKGTRTSLQGKIKREKKALDDAVLLNRDASFESTMQKLNRVVKNATEEYDAIYLILHGTKNKMFVFAEMDYASGTPRRKSIVIPHDKVIKEFDKITKSSKAKTKSIIACYYSKPSPVRANAIGFAKVEKMVIV